jgi:hypothetical protein
VAILQLQPFDHGLNPSGGSEHFYWEMTELARRTILVGWVLLIDERSAFVRLIVAVLISSAALMFTVTKRPFRNWEDQLLATSAQFMLMIVFMGASFIKAIEGVKERTDDKMPGTTFDVFGIDSSEHIVRILLCFIAAIVVHLVGTLTYSIAQEGRLQTMRVRSTGRPPDLTLNEDEEYHLFLSHIWATGQVRLVKHFAHKPLLHVPVHTRFCPVTGCCGDDQAATPASDTRSSHLSGSSRGTRTRDQRFFVSVLESHGFLYPAAGRGRSGRYRQS